MPILHIQLGAQAKTPDGKTAQLSPAIALQLRGPIIQVSVTIEQNAGKGLLSQGKALPVPKSGLALIDTGATGTCIDDQAAKELGLPVIDVAKMTSATHKDQSCNVYPVQINLPSVVLNSPRTMGAALAPQGLLVLIGRDVLQNCTLFYNGPTGQITLSL
jgi:predicted aspartyl protease